MMKQGGGVSFLESTDGSKAGGFNMRTIPELGRDAPLAGQQFRVGQMVNKPLVPNPNFQSSSVNLNSILNVDRSRPLTRDLPESALSSSEMAKRADSNNNVSSKNIMFLPCRKSVGN